MAQVAESPEAGRRAYQGPHILRVGFRPFFLLAGVWSVLALVVWSLSFGNGWDLPSHFSPTAWHSHEMIYGYSAAVAAGFLLTAIPNWTGRLPVRGTALAILALVWILGRLALFGSAYLGPIATALCDLAFLVLFEFLVLREIIAGRNWRNLPVAAAPGLLFLGNLVMHLEQGGMLAQNGLGERSGLAILVLLICLVGGRIIPSFTRNWLAKRGAEYFPAAFGPADKIAMAITLFALVAWVAAPNAHWAAGPSLAAAVANAWRLARWQGLTTIAEPLVWILHLGFCWVPIGFIGLTLLQTGHAEVGSLPVHAFAVGAIGTMTLAVMTRATLGHSGRALTAGPATLLIYLLVTLAAIMRVAAPLYPLEHDTLLAISVVSWVAAFALFTVAYFPLLAGSRPPADS